MRFFLPAIACLALALPSAPVVTKLAVTVAVPIVMAFTATPAEARGGGRRGGGGRVRSNGRQNINAGVNRNRNNNANRNRNNNVNRNTNVNRNRDVNVDRSRHVDIDVNHRYGYGHGNGGAFVAGVATAIAVGAIVNSLPPSCTNYTYSGIAYRNCGGTWYQPQYSGSNVTYIVVNNPG